MAALVKGFQEVAVQHEEVMSGDGDWRLKDFDIQRDLSKKELFCLNL